VAEIDAVKAGAIIDSMYNYIWQFGVVVVLFAGATRCCMRVVDRDMAAFHLLTSPD